MRHSSFAIWWYGVISIVLILVAPVAGCEGRYQVNIDALKQYALDYNPCSKPETTCIALQRTPSNVANVLRHHNVDESFKVYVALILLKLYRAHIENYHQSYDIRRGDSVSDLFLHDPLLEAFSKFSGVSLREEFLSSDVCYKWVLTQKTLLENPLISSEVVRIRKGLAGIEDDRQ